MTNITYLSQDFPAPLSRKPSYPSDRCLITWPELIWSAITVGRESWSDVMRHGNFSYYEIIYRIGILYANLKTDEHTGVILKTEAYKKLDPSEKSAISYFLGLTLTKWACETFMGVSRLMHLDVYKARYSISHGQRRPDLFGLNQSNDWLVAESKGRSGKFDANAFQSAKDQVKNNPIFISGDSPAMRIASQIFFASDALNFRFEDPIEKNGKPIEINVTKDEFINRYYAPFIELLDNADQETKSISNQRFEIVHFREWDVDVGISVDLLKAIRNRDFYELSVILKEQSFEKESQENIKIGSDGVFVRASTQTWNLEQTSIEPKSRFLVEL